eukprot:5892654-Pleurochrysis_carterae.AAC.1
MGRGREGAGVVSTLLGDLKHDFPYGCEGSRCASRQAATLARARTRAPREGARGIVAVEAASASRGRVVRRTHVRRHCVAVSEADPPPLHSMPCVGGCDAACRPRARGEALVLSLRAIASHAAQTPVAPQEVRRPAPDS